MDAVELPYPLDLAVPKIMGSEGFGRAGVTVKVDEACESDGVPVLLNRTVERCSSLTSQTGDVIMSDVASGLHTSESARLDKILETELCRKSCKVPSVQNEHVSEQVHYRSSNCLPSTTMPDSPQPHQTSTKMLKISNLCPTRQGTTQRESMRHAGVDDMKDIHGRHEPRPSNCIFSEKNQLAKQKNHLHSKRSEKRCPRVPPKGKYDSFPVKPSSASLGTASGGNNFLGLYGLTSDVPDVTKLIDDFSLIWLLDGLYEAPNLGKDKGKKETNTNEALMRSVRKAGSILESHRSIQPQKLAEIEDSSAYKTLPTCISTTVSCKTNVDSDETCVTDPASGDKESSSNPENQGNVCDFPLYQPKDVLERLAFPPPKDLESLLLEAAKPILSSRNTPDPRPGKLVTRSSSLPAFQWSYTFSGQSRSNSDLIKLSSTRNTCQGRWGKIGNSPDIACDFPNLDSLRYENCLIPPEYKTESDTSGVLPWFDWGSSSSDPRSKDFYNPLDSGEGVKHEGNDDSCPRILSAAQTLLDMAAPHARQNKDGLTTWQKKASQKTSRPRKSRVNDKGLEIPKPPIPFSGSDTLPRNADQSFTPKKPKLSIPEKKKDPISHVARKGSVNWSSPKSFRSSPNPETRHFHFPPGRVLDKPVDTENKTRTSVPELPFKQPSAMPPPARPSSDKRKAMDIEDTPITSWSSAGRAPIACVTKHPPSRNPRDSEHKLKKLMVGWSNGGREATSETRHTKQLTVKSGETEQRRKAGDGEDRPRKSTVENGKDWRNLDKIMDWK